MSRRGSQRAAAAGLGDYVHLLGDFSSEEDEVQDGVDFSEVFGDEEGWQDDQNEDDNDGDAGPPRRRIRGVPGLALPAGSDDEEEVDDEATDEATDDATDGPPRRGRRILHRNKQINCLTEALNPSNYNMMPMPTAAEEKIFSAVLVRIPEQRVQWTNVKHSNAGRLPRYLLFITMIVYDCL